jgi:hypothetical protein
MQVQKGSWAGVTKLVGRTTENIVWDVLTSAAGRCVLSPENLSPGQAPTNPFEKQGLDPSAPTGYTETHKKFKLHNLNLPSLSCR